jgi:histidinol-phosphate/aromatic aminotransferase/cobyric acid decarboxylase-like protein
VLEELAGNLDTLHAYRAHFESIGRDRVYLEGELARVPGLVVHPSRANFVYVELAPVRDGKALRAELLAAHGIYVCECNKLGFSAAYLRIAVLPAAQTDALVRTLRQTIR